MIRQYQAAQELEAIRNCVAFTVTGAKRRRINQHASLYTFADGSRLRIRTTASRADAWHPAWTGRASDVHLGPVVGVAIRVNH